MRQLGDRKKTSVHEHVKLGVMRRVRALRLYDGKQGRARDREEIAAGVLEKAAEDSEPRCRCSHYEYHHDGKCVACKDCEGFRCS